MKSTPPITAESLRALLRYEPETGHWFWLVDRKAGRGNGRRHIAAGSIAGSVSHVSKGYRKIGINGRRYYAHRLAFLWMTGDWPTQHVDHIDGNGGNNAWSNLRDVNRSQNLQNRLAATRTNKTGILGVSFRRRAKKYVAQITVSGETRWLGCFDTAEEAHATYLDAKRKLHEGNTL